MVMNDNKLIAEFDGWVIHVDDAPIQLYMKDAKVKHIAELRYDESWDLLMSVVEKIESFEGLSVQIEGCGAYVRDEDNCILVQNMNCTLSKIKAVHDMCVRFINWIINKDGQITTKGRPIR